MRKGDFASCAGLPPNDLRNLPGIVQQFKTVIRKEDHEHHRTHL
jgi:hypothetical protein